MTNGFLKKLRNSELLLEGFSRWKESEIVDSNVRSTFRSRQATKSPHVSALVGAHSNTKPILLRKRNMFFGASNQISSIDETRHDLAWI